MNCPECGREIYSSAGICYKCGYGSQMTVEFTTDPTPPTLPLAFRVAVAQDVAKQYPGVDYLYAAVLTALDAHADKL